MRRDLFLHFLNRDTREIYQLFKFHDEPTHFQLLRRALNAAVLLCEDRCIMPPGFAIEDPLAFELAEQQSEYFKSSIVQLPMRETNITEYAEKKRLEYMPMRDRYSGLFSDRRLDFLGQNAKGIIKRKSRIGEKILSGWQDAPDSKLWKDVKRSIGASDIEIVRAIPSILTDKDVALTWSAMETNMPVKAKAAFVPLRNSLQHIYFKEYCDEFKLLIMTGLPFGHEDFWLPNQRPVYNYHRLMKFLDAFQLSEFFASCSASILTYLKARAGCIEFMDAYASLASISKSDADLSFGAQNAAKASKFDWDSFRRRSSSSLFELTQLELHELLDGMSAGANELVRQNGLPVRVVNKTKATHIHHTVQRRGNMSEVVFFVALQEELDVLTKLWSLQKTMKTPAATGKLGGLNIEVLCPSAMGRVPAAVEVASYLESRKNDLPKAIVVLGLAGGFEKSGTDRGHIIVGTTVIDLASRKLIDEKDNGVETKFRRKDYNLPDAMQRYLASDQFDIKAWSDKAIELAEWPKDRRPSIHPGLIASGDEVVSSVDWQNKLLENTDKLLGIEMEAGGVCAASERFQVNVFVLRAVSDKADPAKADDSWRKIGMKTLGLLMQSVDLNAVIKNIQR